MNRFGLVSCLVGLGGGIASAKKTVHALQDPSKLDIYDQPKEPVQVVVVEEPDSIFKESLSSIRKALLSVNEEYHKVKETAISRVMRVNRTAQNLVEGRVAILPKGEELFPGLLYVLVFGMAGSVLTKRSGFLIRKTSPLIFATAGFWFAFPDSSNAIAAKIDEKYHIGESVHNQLQIVSDTVHHRYGVIRDSILNKVNGGKEHKETHKEKETEKESDSQSLQEMYTTRSSDIGIEKEESQ